MSRKREYALQSEGEGDHSLLINLEEDDHPQYLHISVIRIIDVQHTFNPYKVSPFKVGDDAAGIVVVGLNADLLDGMEAAEFAALVHTHLKAAITDLEGITTTPTADSIPLADGTGKIDNGWLQISDVTNAALSPMVVSGALLSNGTGAGTWKMALGAFLLRSTDSATGELVECSITEQDNQPITLADTNYFVLATYDGDSTPTLSISTTWPTDYRSIPVGRVMKTAGGEVHFINDGNRLQDGVAKLARRAFDLRHLELASGCQIA